MAIHIMPGVNLRGLQPQIVLAIQVANEAYKDQGADCIITSCVRDGTWDEVYLHGKGLAVDLAVRDIHGLPLPDGVVDEILEHLNMVIGRPGGGQFDVVDERKPGTSGWTGAHIHIEFDPK